MLKGKAIIELTDVNTGEKTVQVEDNIMTNALEAFFNQPASLYGINSLVGGSAYDQLFHYNVWNLSWATAGLVVSDKALPESPDTLEVPLSSLLGAAAKQYKTQIDDGVYGTYNEAESFIDNEHGVFNHVFDFPTSACNGTVRCLSVMHPGGVINLPYAKYDSFKNNLDKAYRRHYFIGSENVGGAYSNYRMRPCPGFERDVFGNARDTIENTLIGTWAYAYRDYDTNHYSNLNGLKRLERILAFDVTDNSMYTITWTDVDKYVIRKRISKLSMVCAITPFKLIKEYPEVTVTTQSASKYSYGIACVDKATKKAYYITASKNESSTVAVGDSIHLFETDLVTGQQRHFDVPNATGESLFLATGYFNNSNYHGSRRQSTIIHNGNIYIFPNTAVSTLDANLVDKYKVFKIPLDNPSNVTVCRLVNGFVPTAYISGTMPRHIQLLDDRYLSLHNTTMSLILNIENDTIYNDYGADASIINTGTNYIPTDKGSLLACGFIPIIGSKYTMATYSPSFYSNTSDWTTDYFCTFMRLDIPMTINNLSTPIHKTPSQTMKVTYVIREVETAEDEENYETMDPVYKDDVAGTQPEPVDPDPDTIL